MLEPRTRYCYWFAKEKKDLKLNLKKGKHYLIDVEDEKGADDDNGPELDD